MISGSPGFSIETQRPFTRLMRFAPAWRAMARFTATDGDFVNGRSLSIRSRDITPRSD